MTQIGTVELLATVNTSQYKKGVSEIERSNSDIESSADRTGKKIGSSFSTGAQLATAAIVAAGAVIVSTFVSSASEIQSLRASFESLTGNVDDTNAVMTELYNLGKKTAFENKDIQAAGRNYLAAGVAVEDLGEVLKNTADIAGATGANLGQLTLPLTQTIARGKLQTQDFYQILNSGAGALRKPLTELAGKKGFGSLADALEASAITSEDLLTVMGEVTQKGGFAFEGAIKQSETFNGRMSNLREAITNVGLGILGVDAITGKVNPSGPFAKMSNAVSIATKFLTENQGIIKQVGTVIGVFLLPAIIALGVQGLIAGGRIAAGMLLALGPIGLIVAAVAAATYLIIANFDKIRQIASQVGSWFKDVGIAIGNALGNAFKSTINAILGFLESKVNTIVDIINGAIGLIDKVTPGHIDRVSRISLPRLAEGGIVTQSTIAQIGEGGEPEAVIPLSKLDSMLSGNRTGSDNGAINVVVNMSGIMARSRADERDIARGLVERLNEELRAKGKAVIGSGL